MYLPLTDLLTCPRCGPEHGLILLAERIEDRRVLEGTLGCSRCHERYSVAGGFADLRTGAGPGGGADTEPAPLRREAGDRDEAIRLAALMGVAEGPGYVAILGAGAVHAPVVATLIEGLEVIAVDARLAEWPEEQGVSRLAVDGVLPLRSYSLRGVALTGMVESLLEEAARVLSHQGRLMIDPAPAEAEARLERLGLKVAAREGKVLVAARA
jgi:hypothetical protein